MVLSELINKLEAIYAEHGNLRVLQQADSEGNSFDWSQGIEVGYATDDLQYCHTEESAKEDYDDYEREHDLTKCAVIYP